MSIATGNKFYTPYLLYNVQAETSVFMACPLCQNPKDQTLGFPSAPHLELPLSSRVISVEKEYARSERPRPEPSPISPGNLPFLPASNHLAEAGRNTRADAVVLFCWGLRILSPPPAGIDRHPKG
ncbi:MAG TPA: hypothetical protein PLM83_09445 [Bacillota bacterium]|jgi:hypothetical protein|nr:hypothetical protein [Bacillota bacterium]